MEIVLLVLFAWIAPMLVLWMIAENRGRSSHFVWWGFCLGWIGAIIGVAILVNGPKNGR